uniref:Rab3 GTPase-activating protein catalytic subunit n=2 Tax=Timema TaxID=61471 RepID=A0A7R9EYK8_9NEOP|nr:unnamed protein product [Timema bartmani]
MKTRLETRQVRSNLLGDSGYPKLYYLYTPVLDPQTPEEWRYNTADKESGGSSLRVLCYTTSPSHAVSSHLRILNDPWNKFLYGMCVPTSWGEPSGPLSSSATSAMNIDLVLLEEVIHEWKLPQIKKGPSLKKGELTDGEWEEKSEQIIFADVNFTLTRYNLKLTPLEDLVSPIEEDNENIKNQALEDIMSMENVFPPQCDAGNVNGRSTTRPHPLARWYGLRDFMVLAPARGFDISTESKDLNTNIPVIDSPVYCESDTDLGQIPIFVQIHDPWQHFFMGVCEGKGVRSEFEMVHLRRTPPHCKYLTGLLNLFKSKIASPLSLEPVTVSVRFTYVLRDWTSSTWTQEPPDFDFLHGETLGVVELGKLPFGATFDPVSELQLFTTWPQLVENMVVDSESFSDFEPSNAPQWSVRVKMAEQPACLLSEYLSEFTQLCSSQGSMHELIGDLMAERAGPSLSSSLNLLTESRVPTISKVVKRSKQPRKERSQEGPITDDMLTPILYFLFPDADDNHKHPYQENLVYSSSCEGKTNEDLLTGLKSAPVDGLVWRLAVVMSHVVHTLGGAKAAAHLWYEFAQELRFRWEKDIAVPG